MLAGIRTMPPVNRRRQVQRFGFLLFLFLTFVQALLVRPVWSPIARQSSKCLSGNHNRCCSVGITFFSKIFNFKLSTCSLQTTSSEQSLAVQRADEHMHAVVACSRNHAYGICEHVCDTFGARLVILSQIQARREIKCLSCIGAQTGNED